MNFFQTHPIPNPAGLRCYHNLIIHSATNHLPIREIIVQKRWGIYELAMVIPESNLNEMLVLMLTNPTPFKQNITELILALLSASFFLSFNVIYGLLYSSVLFLPSLSPVFYLFFRWPNYFMLSFCIILWSCLFVLFP